MNGDNSDADQMNYPKYAPSQPPKPVHPKTIGKTPTKLGTIATRASLRIKQFVTHEVNIPPPRDIVSGLKHILPGSQQEQGGQPKQPEQLTPEVQTTAERDDKLKKILAESNDVLAKATTVFPFTLFRDDIVVDRTKVTITKRTFFFTSEVMSIRIEDILNVKAATGPFFGSLVLAVRVLSSEDHHTINYFWREDAIRLKHIIQGYVIAQHNQIDTNHLSKEELIATLAELGHDSNS